MEKFRVLSDLHLDINEGIPLELIDKDIFTVICGDTSGYPDKSIKWIKENCPNGVGTSGNHLPYNNYKKTIQDLRDELAAEFSLEKSFTYLDCETNIFSKVVDGIIFIGTCMYSDMRIKHPHFNTIGNKEFNMRASMSHMNDYKFGILRKETTQDNNVKLVKMKADNYVDWFDNAYNKIDMLLTENEKKDNPLPVVLFTHYNLITDFLDHNHYIDVPYSIRDYNWPSYASDKKQWLLKHPSIKCYCCGHIHAVEEKYRNIKLKRNDGTEILVVNNARGYCRSLHDTFFNENTFVNVNTWEVEKYPFTDDIAKERKNRRDRMLAYAGYFI